MEGCEGCKECKGYERQDGDQSRPRRGAGEHHPGHESGDEFVEIRAKSGNNFHINIFEWTADRLSPGCLFHSAGSETFDNVPFHDETDDDQRRDCGRRKRRN